MANNSESETNDTSLTLSIDRPGFFVVCFVCTFGFSWIWIFVADGEPSHQDPESGREKQYPMMLLWSLSASCFYCTRRCGRPTATNTITLSLFIFISFDVFGGRMLLQTRDQY